MAVEACDRQRGREADGWPGFGARRAGAKKSLRRERGEEQSEEGADDVGAPRRPATTRAEHPADTFRRYRETIRGTKTDARRRRVQIISNYEKGLLVPGSETVAGLVERYLEH